MFIHAIARSANGLLDTERMERGYELVAALQMLGGRAHLDRIVRAVVEMRKVQRRPVPKHIAASVRNGLQRHSSEQPHYGGHDDLFRRLGDGVWELRDYGKRVKQTNEKQGKLL